VNHFGIDFGTTNSGAFELNSGQPYGDEETRPLPSVVVIDKATNRAFGGRQAWKDRLALTEKGGYHVISSIKALLESDREWFSAERRWTVADVAAVVLKQLNERARTAGGIQEATFSIPVGMSPKARRVLREAARRAGIQVRGFVKESTAALIRYWEQVKNCRHVVVFDWGGGTLDISVLELRGHGIHELATQGAPVAGDRIDDDLTRFVHHSIMKRRGGLKAIEEVPEPQRDDLRYRCESAKCNLATAEESEFSLFGYDGRNEKVTLTRALCRPVAEPHVRMALDLLSTTIAAAGMSTEAIDEIIIIGGCSQLWLFRELLRTDTRFRGRYTLADSPEWDVAKGAAIVNQNPGCFVLGESLALQLSDGTRFEMVAPGDTAGRAPRSVSVALVEDSRAANIIIDRRIENASERQTALQFSVPTQGFDLEEIRLDYLLTDDLTFRVVGRSFARNQGSKVERETGELRFRYVLDGKS
jgi:molecular chaperone DnaK